MKFEITPKLREWLESHYSTELSELEVDESEYDRQVLELHHQKYHPVSEIPEKAVYRCLTKNLKKEAMPVVEASNIVEKAVSDIRCGFKEVKECKESPDLIPYLEALALILSDVHSGMKASELRLYAVLAFLFILSRIWR